MGAACRDRAAREKVPYEISYIDRNKRPDWFLAVSPHSKVPVLLVDDKEALFESNAIAEYLDETARRGCIRKIRSRVRATARGPTT